MSTLRIEHVGEDDEPRFRVVRVSGGDLKHAPDVTLRPPTGYPVEGRPNSDLVHELQWYLETFLDYPFDPELDHAVRVLDALKKWGRQAFDALFSHRQAAKYLYEAQDDGRYDRLHLQIASDDPRILAWPWEALEDSEAGLLAQTCQIERRLNHVADPPAPDERLPRDRVNILLVTARPHEGDVGFRSISRPLVETVNKQKFPAHVTVLRPPTFDELRRHLEAHPHTYHVLHFDGHGGYGAAHGSHAGGTHCFEAHGVLVFEGADGQPAPISAEQLSNLLKQHAVPAVVLNACQSAMIDERAADPFASVAAALLKAGMRSVVAMAYSLYVSAARQFVPAFYEELFQGGDVARAVRAGRQQMFAQQGRICSRGEFPLRDWLVPVVYQQDPLDFSFAAKAKEVATPRESRLPAEARDTENPHGFIGRDGPLLDLERAMLRPPAGILIQGLGGVGKTTLARGFVEWLEATDGLGLGCMWFEFHKSNIRSAEYVINRMGEPLFGGPFTAAGMDQKVKALAAALKDKRRVIVWDNFEVVKGIPGTSVSARLTEEDRAILLSLLKKLRGGQTKIIITSRSREQWLGHENCFELPIGGLRGDERWEYCAAVLRDLGITPDRSPPEMIELMELLGGHPLAMRAILPKLKDRSASSLAAALRGNLDGLDLPEDEVSAKLAATLRFVEESLPGEQRPLLIPLSLHESYVDTNSVEYMAKRVDDRWARLTIDDFAASLCAAGLLRQVGPVVYELHPVLTGYLRARLWTGTDDSARNAWARAFVDVMGRRADDLNKQPLMEQRRGFHVHGANFHNALTEAERLGMDVHFRAVLQALAAYAHHTRDFAGATRLFIRRAEGCKGAGDHEGEAAAYHQLGMIAEEQRDLAAAEKWYRKSLAIKEKQGNEHGAAITYHQLGIFAQEQRDFAAAEQWYRKSLAIKEKQGNEHGAASSYHHLGMIAQEQRDFAAAEQWYRKSLAIKEKQGDEHGAAITYHQLGVIAGLQEHYEDSGRWFVKCIQVFVNVSDPHNAKKTAADFMLTHRRAPTDVQAKLEAMWREAGLGDLPKPAGDG